MKNSMEWVGYLAMIMTVLSFTFTKQKTVRKVNLISNVLWIIYSTINGTVPLLFTSIFVMIMHLRWFYVKYKN
jgi:hypothetical protein